MLYARLGPSSVLVRVLIYPVQVLHHFLGSKDELHVLAAAAIAAAAAAAAGAQKVLATTPRLKTGIQVTQNDRRANAHHHEQVSLHFEPTSPFYGRFSVQKRPFLDCFGLFSGRSPLRQAGVSNEGRCSFMAIGLSEDGKWVFNKACITPW